jgi:hypothetical protein
MDAGLSSGSCKTDQYILPPGKVMDAGLSSGSCKTDQYVLPPGIDTTNKSEQLELIHHSSSSDSEDSIDLVPVNTTVELPTDGITCSEDKGTYNK